MAGAFLRAASYPILRRLDRWQRFTREGLTPRGRFMLALGFAAGIFGVDTRLNQLHQLFTLALALLVLAGLIALINRWQLRQRFSASRVLPRTACVGQPLSYRVELHSHHPRRQSDLSLIERLPTPCPTRAQFLDPDQGADSRDSRFDRLMGYPRWQRLLARNRWAEHPEPVLLDPLPARARTSARLSLMPTRRGYLRLSTLWLTRSDPFGLVQTRVALHTEQSLLVLPRRYPAPRLHLPGQRRYQPGGWRLASAVGESQEFIGLREYRAGDSPRSIHWPSWARSGEPQVKEYQDEYFTRHALVLDTFARPAQEARFEAAVSVAASLCDRIGDGDSLLDLLFVGTEVHCLTGGRGLAGTGQFLEILACAQPATGEPFARLNDALLERAGALSAVVCILLDFDEPRRALASALQRAGLPTRLLVISGQTPEEISAGWSGAPVQRLHPEHLAEDLARL